MSAEVVCDCCHESCTDWRRYRGHYPREERDGVLGGIDWTRVTGTYLCCLCVGDLLEMLLSGLTDEQVERSLSDLRRQGVR